MELASRGKIFYITVALIITLMALFPMIVLGQNEPPEPLEYIPLVDDLPNVEYQSGNIGGYLEGIFNFLLGLTALFAVVVISFGGIQYITTDAIQGKTDGRGKINQALLGLLLALIAWIILFTINPDLINLDLRPSESVERSQGGDQ